MNWAEAVVGGRWFLVIVFIGLGIRELVIAQRHWTEADKIMRELVFIEVEKAIRDIKKDEE